MWYNPEIKLPKRDKDRLECSVDVLVRTESEEYFTAYVVYENKAWWLLGSNGYAEKIIGQITHWMYIPVISEKTSSLLPSIDGE